MRQDRLVIEPYDARWPESFEAQRTVVEHRLDRWLVAPVEHIGSTAVPGLPAKPIVDMVAIVGDYDEVADGFAELARVDWVTAPEPGDEANRRRSLCSPHVALRTHHLHVVEQSSQGWPDWLLFRDYLRERPDAARRYARLKRQLVADDAVDRVRYRAGKAPLIRELQSAARRWADTDHPGSR